MPIEIRKDHLRNLKADAVVNPSDHFLSGLNAIDRQIHSEAVPALDLECGKVYYLNSGSAVITDSYGLGNYRYIIHICGPDYVNGNNGEEKVLKSCFEEVLKLAKANQIASLVIPMYDSGTFGFPKGQAIRIASDTISEYLTDYDMDVILLVDSRDFLDSRSGLYKEISTYLNKLKPQREEKTKAESKDKKKEKNASHAQQAIHSFGPEYEEEEKSVPLLFDEELSYTAADAELSQTESYPEASDLPSFEPDESFSECLIRMIDEKEMEDPQVYKSANIDRKHFNHIKNTKNYRPKKETAVALAIGMKLDMKETDALLEKAGFLLSKSSKFDLIIRYCIEHSIYDIFRINEILFAEDQKTLGC